MFLAFGFSASRLSSLVCCLLLAAWLLGFPSWFAVVLASNYSFLALKLLASWLPRLGFPASWLLGFPALLGFVF